MGFRQPLGGCTGSKLYFKLGNILNVAKLSIWDSCPHDIAALKEVLLNNATQSFLYGHIHNFTEMIIQKNDKNFSKENIDSTNMSTPK